MRSETRVSGARVAGGFTLIELLVALALIGLIGTWLVRFVGAQQRAFARQSAIVAATQNARAAAEILLVEARSAGFDPRERAGAGITHAAADSFGWTADLNADGDLLDADEQVLYFWDPRGGRLLRRANGRDAPLVEGLDRLDFTYTDRLGAPTTVPSAIAGLEASIRFTALAGEFRATLPVATRLPNLAR